ncbi:uncharacterized protein LOC131471310 [Solea solea]|uniref:uncharacterized protein LOC131471310 n=1 Tax=Solea solea TaxID=90069 RepID=UPI00272BC580|nr:uncharacterized protein LOC131471310 [Solea solea]
MLKLLFLAALCASCVARPGVMHYSFDPAVGPGSGTSFSSAGSGGRITAVRVWEATNAYITGIQVRYDYIWSRVFGRVYSTAHELNLFDGEVIVQVSGKYHTNYIYQLTFVTSRGRSMIAGQPYQLSFNFYTRYEDAELILLSGRYNSAGITSLAAHWGVASQNTTDTSMCSCSGMQGLGSFLLKGSKAHSGDLGLNMPAVESQPDFATCLLWTSSHTTMLKLLFLAALCASCVARPGVMHYSFDPAVGPGAGTSFSSAVSGGRITAVRVWEATNAYITGIQVRYDYIWSRVFGRVYSTAHELNLFDGEVIVQVSGKYHTNYIYQLTLVTSRGRSMIVGQPYQLSFNFYTRYEDAELILLSGRYNSAGITSLAAHWGVVSKNTTDNAE